MGLQVAVPQKRDGCVDLHKAIIEPFSFGSALGEDANGSLPVVAKLSPGEQLAELSSACLDRPDVGGDPITLGKHRFFHVSGLRCIEGNKMSGA